MVPKQDPVSKNDALPGSTPDSFALEASKEKPSRDPASKAQRNLADLLRDIAACRAEIVTRSTSLEDLQRRLQTDLGPLEIKLVEIRLGTFRILGKQLLSGWMSKRDRQTLESALWDFAAELEMLFNVDMTEDRRRFLGEDKFVTKEEKEEDGIQNSLFDDLYGAGDEFGGYRESDFQQEPPKSSSKREGASRPARKNPPQEDAIAGDIRALYLLLARALHPDKESDPLRRGEKTVWMQKVTEAYGNRNLAGLLDILSRNPLDAVGPYLSQAPLNTVRGFAKRLRRDLTALKQQIAILKLGPDPFIASLLRDGRVHEPAYARHMAEFKKEIKFQKNRSQAYASAQGVRELVAALRIHDWDELM